MTTEQIEKIVNELGFIIDNEERNNFKTLEETGNAVVSAYNEKNELLRLFVGLKQVTFVYTQGAYTVNNSGRLNNLYLSSPTNDKIKVMEDFLPKLVDAIYKVTEYTNDFLRF